MLERVAQQDLSVVIASAGATLEPGSVQQRLSMGAIVGNGK